MMIMEVIYEYHGLWTPGASCGLQIFSSLIDVPTVVLSELPCNGNTSVTNLVECIAAEVLQTYLAGRTGKNPPFHCIEHYPREDGSKLQETFDLVTFDLNAPVSCWIGGRSRISLGEPEWKPIDRSELERMIGCLYPDPLAIVQGKSAFVRAGGLGTTLQPSHKEIPET
jgi:hypothetical protein